MVGMQSRAYQEKSWKKKWCLACDKDLGYHDYCLHIFSIKEELLGSLHFVATERTNIYTWKL